MPYVHNALTFTIETIGGLYLIVVILRFLFQLLSVEFRNPLSQVIFALTHPPLTVLRRFLPGLYGIDLATIALVLLVATLKNSLLLLVSGYAINLVGALVLGVGESLNTAIWILLITIIVRAVLSWFASSGHHPVVRILVDLSEPVLQPFRRILPGFQGIDLSPILALLALNLLQKLVVSPITDAGLLILQ